MEHRELDQTVGIKQEFALTTMKMGIRVRDFFRDMQHKQKALLLVLILIMCVLLYFKLMRGTRLRVDMIVQTMKMEDILRMMKTEDTLILMSNKSLQSQPDSYRYRRQRDAMSRQLNLVMQAYGQLNCEHMSLQSKSEELDSKVSENGGWCAFASSEENGFHLWDKGFSTALSSFLRGKVVASFGDGPGHYKKHIDSLSEVLLYLAYDGAPFCDTMTRGLVKFLDLTAPQYGLRAFDWVVSVEVGEHIPPQFEDVYLDNIARHAREGIILSWAPPGQSGLSHVNNKPLEDVVAKLKIRGFNIDVEAGMPLREAAMLKWLKNNVHVYRRVNVPSFVEEDV